MIKNYQMIIFSEILVLQTITLLKSELFTSSFQGIRLLFKKTYFKEHLSVAASL